MFWTATKLLCDAVLPALAAQNCLPNDASWTLQASRTTGSALCSSRTSSASRAPNRSGSGPEGGAQSRNSTARHCGRGHCTAAAAAADAATARADHAAVTAAPSAAITDGSSGGLRAASISLGVRSSCGGARAAEVTERMTLCNLSSGKKTFLLPNKLSRNDENQL